MTNDLTNSNYNCISLSETYFYKKCIFHNKQLLWDGSALYLSLSIYLSMDTPTNMKGTPCAIMANVQDSNSAVNEIEIQSPYNVHSIRK